MEVHSKAGEAGSPAPRWAAWLPGALLLAGVVLAAARFGEGERFARLLAQARPVWLLAAFALQTGTYSSAAAVWQRVLRRAGIRVRLRSLIPLAVARLFVDQILPTAGFGGRLLIVKGLRRRGIDTGIAVTAILVDLLTLYAAFAAAVAASLFILWRFHDLNRLVLGLASLFSVFATAIPLSVLWLSRSGHREPPRWVRFIPRAEELLEQTSQSIPSLVRDPRVLGPAGALQLAVFFLDASTLWAMLRAVGHPAAPAAVFASFILASVAATVIMVPGGLGTFEASSVALLTLVGIPVEAALTATLLQRGFTYWLPMVPGLLLSRRELARPAAEH